MWQSKHAGNTDKQGGNILIQTISGDREAMGKKKDIRVAKENVGHGLRTGSMADCIEPEALASMKDMDIREAD